MVGGSVGPACMYLLCQKGEVTVKTTLTGWSCSTPGPIIQTNSAEIPSSESVTIVTSEGSNGINRSAVSKSSSVGNDSIH